MVSNGRRGRPEAPRLLWEGLVLPRGESRSQHLSPPWIEKEDAVLAWCGAYPVGWKVDICVSLGRSEVSMDRGGCCLAL